MVLVMLGNPWFGKFPYLAGFLILPALNLEHSKNPVFNDRN